MKKLFFILPLFISLIVLNISHVSAADPTASKYFELENEISTKNYVLYDFLEFSFFDLSEMEITVVNGTGEKDVGSTQKLFELVKSNLPRYFYQSLRDEIMNQKIPVTLYPADSPPHANPIRLSIRVKQIKVAAKDSKKGNAQELFLKIYGQIKDKKTGSILIKFYDSGRADGEVTQWDRSLKIISQSTMSNLGRYLKTKY